MTTKAREELYRAQHNVAMEGKSIAIYNPKNKTIGELPIIYGFNNGGSDGWYSAQLIAEDGTALGGHVCSHECYMPSDLGVLEGTRPDRHEKFREHYPDGYRMHFVPYHEVREHEGLKKAFELNDKKREEAEKNEG